MRPPRHSTGSRSGHAFSLLLGRGTTTNSPGPISQKPVRTDGRTDGRADGRGQARLFTRFFGEGTRDNRSAAEKIPGENGRCQTTGYRPAPQRLSGRLVRGDKPTSSRKWEESGT